MNVASKQAQIAIGEGEQLLAQLDKQPATTKGGPYGSDVSVLLDKLWAWIKTALANQTGGAQKAVLHFIHETALPKLKDYTPMMGDVMIDLLIMAVKGWCDSIPEPTPA